MFQPSFPDSSVNTDTFTAMVKSLIELIRMKEKYEALSRINQSPQLTVAQQLLTKVGEESCKWVRTSIPFNVNHAASITTCVYICNYQTTQITIHALIFMQLKSADLPIDSDCTNINLSQLEQVYSRLELYDTIVNTMSAVSHVIPVSSHRIHYCAWMNNRILDNCSNQNMDYSHFSTLNAICRPNRRGPKCDPHLCIRK